MFYDFLTILFRPAAWWGRMEVEGLENVPVEGPLLVVPNHDSQWDPILAALAIKPVRRLRFLAKASLFRWPLVGLILYAAGQIPIKRGQQDSVALEKAIEVLQAVNPAAPG